MRHNFRGPCPWCQADARINKPAIILIPDSPDPRIAAATRDAVESFVAHINANGEAIYHQYINAPPMTGGFDWFMPSRAAQSNVEKEGAD